MLTTGASRWRPEIRVFLDLGGLARASHQLVVEPMDSLIRAAWTAFWIGLGASAVLIGQPLLAEPASGDAISAPAESFVTPRSASAPAPLRGPSAMTHGLAHRWRVRS
jgi:hypothetical protein